LVIAVSMHLLSVLPRALIDAAVAQSLLSRCVRLGPTVPVVPAAPSVWQLPHPPAPVNSALPAAAVAVELELELEPELELELELERRS
jgi:hypothetical protein